MKNREPIRLECFVYNKRYGTMNHHTFYKTFNTIDEIVEFSLNPKHRYIQFDLMKLTKDQYRIYVKKVNTLHHRMFERIEKTVFERSMQM